MEHFTPEMTVITTHVNADFDGIASMLAAQKLYEGSKVVFPGASERNPRDFFVSSMVYLFNMISIKDVDFKSIKRLVLVDTRQKARIGIFADILNREDLEIHIYDHHPKVNDDINGAYEVCRLTGATVTIMIDMLRKRGIPLTADEATVMCLGIYEDTGSFTFQSSTEEDFHAAAYLLSCGANLSTVADMISREMNSRQVGLLNDLITSADKYVINGVDVMLSNVSTEEYVADFAFVVHKFMKMENPGALFVLARMGNKVYLIARSRVSEVDVGAIIRIFGGGGHSLAASATIKDQTLVEIQRKLIEILYQKVYSRQAHILMSSPAIGIKPDLTIINAKETLNKYNVNALLVWENDDQKDKLLGLITRQVVEKALYHKLDNVLVKEYMTSELHTVSPSATLSEIKEKIIGNKQRILPVVENDKVIGVITRTDILNVLIADSHRLPENPPDSWDVHVHARTKDISNLIKERLPERIIEVLKKIGEVADQIACSAYVVGGFVRDLLLSRKNEDVDIVIEGDGILFAQKFAAIMNARVHCHSKFQTAVVIFPDGFKIDIATARTEYYQFPAALPTIEKSSIKLDLYRRDFTINTLVIELNPKHFGILVDFFGAYKDIKDKTVRVLHNLSFVEDPTRVLRAIRFEQRFEFTIGKFTSGLIENSIKMNFFKQLGGRRVFTELRQILEEENPLPALNRMNEYDLFHAVHPELSYNKQLETLCDMIGKVIAWHNLLYTEKSYLKWSIYFMALVRHTDPKTCVEICNHLGLSQKMITLVCNERIECEKAVDWLEHYNKNIKNSDLYNNLISYSTELILYMMAFTKMEHVRRQLSNFYTKLTDIKPILTGKDLMNLGIEQGPSYGKIFKALLEARLNNEITTREDEINLVEKLKNSNED